MLVTPAAPAIAPETIAQLCDEHAFAFDGRESKFDDAMNKLALVFTIEKTRCDYLLETCGDDDDQHGLSAQQGKVALVQSIIADLDAFHRWSTAFSNKLYALGHPEDPTAMQKFEEFFGKSNKSKV